MYILHSKAGILNSRLWCTVSIFHCSMHTVHCSVYSVRCNKHTLHCKVYSTLHLPVGQSGTFGYITAIFGYAGLSCVPRVGPHSLLQYALLYSSLNTPHSLLHYTLHSCASLQCRLHTAVYSTTMYCTLVCTVHCSSLLYCTNTIYTINFTVQWTLYCCTAVIMDVLNSGVTDKLSFGLPIFFLMCCRL